MQVGKANKNSVSKQTWQPEKNKRTGPNPEKIKKLRTENTQIKRKINEPRRGKPKKEKKRIAHFTYTRIQSIKVNII